MMSHQPHPRALTPPMAHPPSTETATGRTEEGPPPRERGDQAIDETPAGAAAFVAAAGAPLGVAIADLTFGQRGSVLSALARDEAHRAAVCDAVGRVLGLPEGIEVEVYGAGGEDAETPAAAPAAAAATAEGDDFGWPSFESGPRPPADDAAGAGNSKEEDVDDPPVAAPAPASEPGGLEKKRRGGGKWEEMLGSLRRYKAEHGTCRVPRSKKNEETRRLGVWVCNQRKAYRRRNQGKQTWLTDERVRMLDDVGFVWRPDADRPKKSTWEDRFEQLKKFVEENGHCHLWQGGRLAVWCSEQRRQYALFMEGEKSKLTAERIEALESLSFDWAQRRHVRWTDWIERLGKFKEEHGHCDVPRDYHDQNLYSWVLEMRRQYRRRRDGQENSLSHERLSALMLLGFDFRCVRSRSPFDERVAELKAWKVKYGHTRVPQFHTENLPLAHWVEKQRHEYEKFTRKEKSLLDAEKIARLNEVGFEWQLPSIAESKKDREDANPAVGKLKEKDRAQAEPAKESSDRPLSWRERIAQLQAYRKTHGGCNVPENYTDRDLAAWVRYVRREYEKKISGEENDLSDECLQALESMKFAFTGRCGTTFDKRLEDLKAWKAKHGTNRVPRKFDTEDMHLYQWASRMRWQYKKFINGQKSFLTTEKIARLEEIGFEWPEMTETRKQKISVTEWPPAESSEETTRMNRRSQRAERNVGRIASLPVQRVRREENGNGGSKEGNEGVPFVVTLSQCPRDLHILWQEYMFGIDGRKPARQFTRWERGRVKSKYCRRKVVWDTIDRLVRSGYTAELAIEKIYSVYGQLTVTDIINRMRKDAQNGSHPYVRVSSIARKQDVFGNEYRQDKAQTNRRSQKAEGNVKTIASQPIQRVRREKNGDGGGKKGKKAVPFVATLSSCPRDLRTLWQEYQFGIDGRKPARQFTPSERGRVKHAYSRRKVVWDMIDRLVRSGYTAQLAIEKIYSVYGQLSVTDMIKRMRQDAKFGGHPEL